MFGTSMGGITAIASIVVLGDGSLASADLDPDALAHDRRRHARRSSPW